MVSIVFFVSFVSSLDLTGTSDRASFAAKLLGRFATRNIEASIDLPIDPYACSRIRAHGDFVNQ
jgi:hypothetical protein